MSFTAIIRQSIADLLATERLSADELATRVTADNIEDFTAEAERMAMATVRRTVKDVLRSLEADDDQAALPLPGLRMPSAIAVRSEDRVYYVLTARATWAEVLAGAEERGRNVTNALIKQRQYGISVDRLRPLMENDPDLTVAEALQREHADAQRTA